MEISQVYNWDAISGNELKLFVSPGTCPSFLLYNNDQCILIRGNEAEILVQSGSLAAEIQKRQTVIIVEADELIFRISEVACKKASFSLG